MDTHLFSSFKIVTTSLHHRVMRAFLVRFTKKGFWEKGNFLPTLSRFGGLNNLWLGLTAKQLISSVGGSNLETWTFISDRWTNRQMGRQTIGQICGHSNLTSLSTVWFFPINISLLFVIKYGWERLFNRNSSFKCIYLIKRFAV
jgi:hypothetical protein